MSLKNWEKKNKIYKDYIQYIENKDDRFDLTYIDLLYIRNFKGGAASIHEKEIDANNKLKAYSKILKKIEDEFNRKGNIKKLNENQMDSLKEKMKALLNATKENRTKIDGFKASRASALLHFYFPDLLPIMDKNVLVGIGEYTEKDGKKKVDYTTENYSKVIDHFHHHLKGNDDKSLREYDKEFFI